MSQKTSIEHGMSQGSSLQNIGQTEKPLFRLAFKTRMAYVYLNLNFTNQLYKRKRSGWTQKNIHILRNHFVQTYMHRCVIIAYGSRLSFDSTQDFVSLFLLLLLLFFFLKRHATAAIFDLEKRITFFKFRQVFTHRRISLLQKAILSYFSLRRYKE